MEQTQKTKADNARDFLAAVSRTFEKDGLYLRQVRFVRDEQTGDLQDVLLTYEDREAGKGGDHD